MSSRTSTDPSPFLAGNPLGGACSTDVDSVVLVLHVPGRFLGRGLVRGGDQLPGSWPAMGRERFPRARTTNRPAAQGSDRLDCRGAPRSGIASQRLDRACVVHKTGGRPCLVRRPDCPVSCSGRLGVQAFAHQGVAIGHVVPLNSRAKPLYCAHCTVLERW